MKTCLLITPQSFYSYSEYVRKTLEGYSYAVTVSNDEYPSNNIGKVMGKLKIPLLVSMSRKRILKDFVHGKSYDLVLIIKGRGVDGKLLEQLKMISGKVLAYTYDSFEFHDAPLKWFKDPNLDCFSTFDYADSEKYGIPLVELFTSMPANTEAKKLSYQLSAIVRNHTDRLSYIDKVLTLLPTQSKFIYVYEKSLYTFCQNFLKNPLLYLKYWKHIHFKALDYATYARVIRESNYTIDYALPVQTGLTMRCFESLSGQTKVITNNAFVHHYKAFDNRNAIVFNKGTSEDTVKQAYAFQDDYTPPAHRRSIYNFIEDLIQPAVKLSHEQTVI